MTATPAVVSAQDWQHARDDLLEQEKEVRRALDALAARRRRLPMTPFDGEYTFDTAAGPRSLRDLFGEHDQLVVYQFMDHGPDHYCPGCTWFSDNVPSSAPALLAQNGVAYVVVSDMPLAQLNDYWSRRGWTLPVASSHGTTFSADTGAGSGFALSVFLRAGGDVHRTYSTTSRGIDGLAFVTGVLDLTPYGRREEWEDSPEGWPQQETAIMPNLMGEENVSVSFGRFR